MTQNFKLKFDIHFDQGSIIAYDSKINGFSGQSTVYRNG